MTRVNGRRPEPKLAFINEWSKLKQALAVLRYQMADGPSPVEPLAVAPSVVTDLLDEVPRLMDAYAELWELMEAAIKAQEQQEASKDTLYVPDAAEMVANASRTKR